MPASVSTARLQPPAAAEPEGASRSEEGWLGFMETMQIVVSSWDKALVVASIVTSSLFVLVLVFQVLATGAARKAAEAARAAVDEARRSNDMALQEQSARIRPWLAIGFPVLSHVTDESGTLIADRDRALDRIMVPDALDEHWRFHYTVPVTNYGEYPAAALNYQFVTGFDLEEVETKLRRHFVLGASVLVPKQTSPQPLPITTDLYQRFCRSGESYFVGVSARYLDRDSNEWLVDAVYKLSGSTVTTVSHSLPRGIPLQPPPPPEGDASTADRHVE